MSANQLDLYDNPTSLSSRRAWIEITQKTSVSKRLFCRSPHGERGLKSHIFRGYKSVSICRSPHGERGLKWSLAKLMQEKQKSLSSRRAWIEIISHFAVTPKISCRSPHGERGLKCLYSFYSVQAQRVALLTESVD